MKRSLPGILCALALALAACTPAITPQPTVAPPANPYNLIQPGVLTAATIDQQLPITMLDQNGKRVGFGIDVVDDIARRLGLTTTYSGMALTALLPGVGNHQYDLGACTLSATTERKQTTDFSEPYFWGYSALLVATATPFRSLDELAGKSVGVTRASLQEQILHDQYPQVVSKSFDGAPSELAALRGGQVDAVFTSGAEAEQYSKQDSALTTTQSLALETGSSMPVAKGDSALLDAVNAQIDTMIKDGTYKRLWSKWFAAPILPPFISLHPELATQS